MNSNEEVKSEVKDEPHGTRGSGCGHGHGYGFGRRRLCKIPFFILGIVLIKSALVMLLWNELIPELFHGPSLTYVQALGLTVLAKLLVGFGGGPRGFGGRHGGHLRAHWANLSPEEREKLRAHLRGRCGHRD